jgi:hypothetical protein
MGLGKRVQFGQYTHSTIRQLQHTTADTTSHCKQYQWRKRAESSFGYCKDANVHAHSRTKHATTLELRTKTHFAEATHCPKFAVADLS